MFDLWAHLAAIYAAAPLFIYLALNNLAVLLLLWLVSAAWFYYAARSGAPRKRVWQLAFFCYLFFFLKEILRVSCSIIDFSRDCGVPYRDIMINLILPHGLIEYLGFVLAVAFALTWLDSSLESGCQRYPGHRAIFIPTALIFLAAAVESTLTPYLYEVYLLNS